METSASCEARYTPLLYPTNQVLALDSGATASGWLPRGRGGLARFRLLSGRRSLFRGVYQFEQLPGCPLWDSASMKMRDMSPELFNSVACPTCRVSPGRRCLLHSGGLRVEPHVDRKLAAMEAVETRETLLSEGRRLRKAEAVLRLSREHEQLL
jgi:hypothetical protein